MKKRSFWICAIVALAASAVLAGCGTTSYFAGRSLPPSGLTNRVLIAIQNPSILTKGALEIVDAYYDIRGGYNGTPGSFSVSGFGAALPVTIQNMPEEQLGAIYSSGDGSLTLADYSKEKTNGSVSGLNGASSSVFITRDQKYIFAASQSAHVLSVIDQSLGSTYPLSLPGIYRISVNPGGSVALAFVQNSNYIYYPRALSAAQTLAYAGGTAKWPKAAVDCEPQNAPGWCLFQAQSPDAIDSTGSYYGAPLVFDHPEKAIFSADGSTAYVLNCGPECGGATASISMLPTAPMIFTLGLASGKLPTSVTSIAVPAASNALLSGSTMYVVGQQQSGSTWAGTLSVLNMTNNSIIATTPISDGLPGGVSRMILADDNTLWIGMTKCDEGVRAANGQPNGCLTMFNTSTNKVTLLEPFLGDLTGIAAVTGLHKIYVAQGGQVYIYSTTNGNSINNQFVTVTGTAYDVAYMDGTTDSSNTVY